MFGFKRKAEYDRNVKYIDNINSYNQHLTMTCNNYLEKIKMLEFDYDVTVNKLKICRHDLKEAKDKISMLQDRLDFYDLNGDIRNV